jgi:MarR family 2-MHQ and catechol resistance regulon transcriptional repressor
MSFKAGMPGPRYEPLLQLLRTAETLWNVSRVFLDRWEISPSQFNVLNLASLTEDGLTQSELSRKLIMHRSNLTGLVDRLEQRSLVKRRSEPGDRRAWRIVLTIKGKKLLAEILPQYHQLAEQVWGTISVGEAERIAGDLGKLSGHAAALLTSISDDTR